jgi:hypothetical protein
LRKNRRLRVVDGPELDPATNPAPVHGPDRARAYPLTSSDIDALARNAGIPPSPQFAAEVESAIVQFVEQTMEGMGWRWMTFADVLRDSLAPIVKGPERAVGRIIVAARKVRSRPSLADLAVVAFVVRHTDINIDFDREHGAHGVNAVELLAAVKRARVLSRAPRGRGKPGDELLTTFVRGLLSAAGASGEIRLAGRARGNAPPPAQFVDMALGFALQRAKNVRPHRQLTDVERIAISKRLDELEKTSERGIADRIALASTTTSKKLPA